jgi:hypothetical protein
LGTLNKPTVGDVIKKLAEYPPDIPLRIEDADTNKTISVIHFAEAGGELILFGKYEEME